MSCSLSRGLDESLGEDDGCNNAVIVEDWFCSGVNDNPKAEDMERGSSYKKTVSGESRRKVSEQSPCSEESVKESLVTDETRHFMAKENSSKVPVQPSVDFSSIHLPSKSAISSDLIELLFPSPVWLERVQQTAFRAEEDWRKSQGWPALGA